MALRKPSYSASVLAEALQQAEGSVVEQPPTPGTQVSISPGEIRLRPELFQPREFSFGLREVDPDHRDTLLKRIEIYGELDPPLVIKINGEWVCVDGHHRLAAYEKARRGEPITCDWFAGSIREALDESVARNNKDKLSVPLADRLEGAWKRVLLDMGSKSDVAQLFGVGTTTIASMRAVRRAYDEDAVFRAKLGDILDASWSRAKLVRTGMEPEDAGEEIRAQQLARTIGRRLSKLLSADSKRTARALAILDPKLPDQLVEAWLFDPDGTVLPDLVGFSPQDAKELALVEQRKARGTSTLHDLERRRALLERESARVDAAIAELKGPAAPSRTDDVWDSWVLTDRIHRDLDTDRD